MQCASSTTSSPTRSTNSGSISSRNCGLFNRSGLMSSRSTESSARRPLHLLPRIPIGRVDRVRANPQPLSRSDLIAHQSQQRRHDQSRPSPPLAQERGGDEVDRRLAPARPLNAQHARAVLDEVANRLELVGAEGGVGSGEVGEQRGGAVLEGHCCHHTDIRRRRSESAPASDRRVRCSGRETRIGGAARRATRSSQRGREPRPGSTSY